MPAVCLLIPKSTMSDARTSEYSITSKESSIQPQEAAKQRASRLGVASRHQANRPGELVIKASVINLNFNPASTTSILALSVAVAGFAGGRSRSRRRPGIQSGVDLRPSIRVSPSRQWLRQTHRL